MTEETQPTQSVIGSVKIQDAEEPRKEEKLTSIMEAANALTALGDEDEVAPESAPNTTTKGNDDDHDDDVCDKDHTVDKPTEENASSSNEIAASVAADEQQELSSPVAADATSTATTVPPPPPPPPPSQEDGGTVTSEKSGATGASASYGGTNSTNSKRFLPEHKKPDAAPTFPEKMMALMRSVDEHKDDPNYCAAWLPEGKSFVVRNPDEFARQVVPKFFKATKFSSFTRKLYRWGFRQINRGIGPDDPVIFGNEFFERDNEALMSQMRSITAAGTRKTESRIVGTASHPHNMYGKRPFEGVSHHNMYDTYAEQQKRYLYEQFMHQQKNAQMMQQQHNPTMYGGMSTNGPMHMNHHPMNGGSGGPIMDSGYPPPHHMLPPMGSKPYDMMPSMHPDGPSQPMMMNMGYNPMHPQHMQQQQPQPQHHSPPQPITQQHQHQGGAMIGSAAPGMVGTPTQQHNMGPSMVGPGIGPNTMMTNSPPQQQGAGGGGGGSVGPSQGGYNNGGASSGGTGNQNTTEIVNAAIRALHYSA